MVVDSIGKNHHYAVNGLIMYQTRFLQRIFEMKDQPEALHYLEVELLSRLHWTMLRLSKGDKSEFCKKLNDLLEEFPSQPFNSTNNEN